MKRPQTIEHFRRPELFFAELVNQYARDELGRRNRILYRALVVAVDVDGGQLENPDGAGGVTHVSDGKRVSFAAKVGPRNPRNSVKARILTDEFDQFLSDEDLLVFWPLIDDHDSIPIKPGEHVYVMFEDDGFKHGLWVARVSGHEGVNYARGADGFASGAERDPFNDSQQGTDSDPDLIASGRLSPKDLTGAFGDF